MEELNFFVSAAILSAVGTITLQSVPLFIFLLISFLFCIAYFKE